MDKTFWSLWNGRQWILSVESCTAAVLAILVCCFPLHAGPPLPNALPTGAQVVAGQASINQQVNRMNITQATPKLITNWQTFNIGRDAAVNFKQPNASSVALNRVLSVDPSKIYGSLTANGQLFLLNPGGVIFGKGARIDVGGLAISTLNMKDSDFLAGKYTFEKGLNAGGITNDGKIQAANGGYLAFIAPRIENNGEAIANQGTVAMAAGDKVSLDFAGDKIINFTIDKGAVDALVANKGLVKADGGEVVLTAKAADKLTQAVVNNSGIIQAKTLENKAGRILLISDMESGETIAGGTLDASAPNGGDGGFIETSAAKVTYGENFTVTAGALFGTGGLWLIDPADTTIDQTAANGYATTLNTGTSVQNAVTGNITMNDNVSIAKTAGGDATLTFKASGSITLGASTSISSTLGKLNVVLWADADADGADSGGGFIATSNPSSITTNGGHLWMGGGGGSTSWNGLAVGNGYAVGNSTNSNGILIWGATINTDGGNIAMYGKSRAGVAVGGDTNVNVEGIRFAKGSNTSINSGTGNIYMEGISRGTGGWDDGVAFDSRIGGATHSVTSAAPTGNAITIVGDGSGVGAASSSSGVWLHPNATISATGGGSISITGTGGSTSSYNEAIWINSGGTSTIDAGTGGLTLVSRKNAINVPYAILKGGATSLIAETTDHATRYGITANNASNDFTGAVSVVGSNVDLRDTNAIQLGASTITGNLTLQGGGAITQSGAISVAGTTSITAGSTNNVALTNTGNDFSGAVTVSTGKNITLLDANAMTLGAVTSTGTVDIATLTGDLTLSGNITTTDTTANAIKLNAGKNTAAGTATGGDILISGSPTISTGAGGFAALYSGSTAGSTGLTTLIGSGSGRFRYNSDETATNYTTALTTGKNAIYREQPTLTVTPGSQTITYGDATPAFSATVGTAYVNGDSSAGTVSGTATWTVGGTTSTSGNSIAGSHDVSYFNGLASSLGYGFVDNGTSKNELTVNQKSLTVSGITANSKVYDTTTATTLGGTAAITPLLTDVVTIGGTASGTFADKNVGTNKAVTVTGNTISGTDAGNYTLVQQTGLTANITKANLSVTGVSAVNKVYDAGTTATLSGTAGITPLGSDTVNLGGTASGTFADKNVGAGKAVTVTGNTISGTDAGNYTLVQQTGLTANITAKTVTLSGSKTYDGTTNLAGAMTVGTGITGEALTYTGATANDAHVATANKYINAITLADDTGLAGNYQLPALNVANAPVTINARTLNVTYTGQNKVYDGTTSATVATSDDRVSGDVLAINRTANFTPDKNVGTNKTVNVTGVSLSDTDAGNYTLASTTGSTTADITARTLNVTYTGVNKAYDGTTTATVTTSDNRVSGDALTINRSAAFPDKNVGTGKTVSVTGVSLSDTDAGNYTAAATGSTTADITPKNLTSSYTANNKVYDGTTAATVSGSSSDIIGGDIVTFSNTAATFASKNVGTNKTVSVSGIAIGGTDAGNYSLQNTTTSPTADITARPVTLTAPAVTKTYDGGLTYTTQAADLTSLAGSLVGGDTISAATISYTTKHAGTNKTVTLDSAAISDGNSGNNYSVTLAGNATSTINKTPLTITATTNTKTYDGATSAAAAPTVSGIQGSDTVTGLAETYDNKNADTGKTLTVTGYTVNDGNSGGNYTVTTVADTTGVINKAPLTITADDKSKTYGDLDPVLTERYSGLVAGETASVVSGLLLSAPIGAAATAGTHVIGISGGTANNYVITLQNGTLTVAKAMLTATADDKSKSQGSGDPELTYAANGFRYTDGPGNVFTGAISRTSGQTAGEYPITQGSLVPNSNYTLTFNNGKFTITPVVTLLATPLITQAITPVQAPVLLSASGVELTLAASLVSSTADAAQTSGMPTAEPAQTDSGTTGGQPQPGGAATGGPTQARGPAAGGQPGGPSTFSTPGPTTAGGSPPSGIGSLAVAPVLPVAPAPQAERIVLLPDAEGRTGSIVVITAKGEVVLDKPYQTAVLTSQGEIETKTTDPAEVQSWIGATLTAQPMRPISFIIYFKEGKDELTDESKPMLEQCKSELLKRASPEVTVIGHTDRVGSVAYNDALSLKRADSVRKILIKSDIAVAKIEVMGRGERQPIVPTKDSVPEPRNRRVEINVR